MSKADSRRLLIVMCREGKILEKSKFDWHSKKMRILVGVGVPVFILLAVSAVVVLLLWLEKGPPCQFYSLTGLYCPGCGMGRAAMALIHGDILLAFRNQPLVFIFGPFVAYYLLKVYIAYVFQKDVLPFFDINIAMGIAVVAVIVLFWILRNIPVAPFTYLAPV